MEKLENPFELLARNPIELSLLSVKSKLMIIIKKLIHEKQWSQAQAAEKLGVTQPRISNLINGKIHKFSIDTLLEILGKLGYLLDITFNPECSDNPIDIKIKHTIV